MKTLNSCWATIQAEAASKATNLESTEMLKVHYRSRNAKNLPSRMRFLKINSSPFTNLRKRRTLSIKLEMKKRKVYASNFGHMLSNITIQTRPMSNYTTLVKCCSLGRNWKRKFQPSWKVSRRKSRNQASVLTLRELMIPAMAPWLKSMRRKLSATTILLTKACDLFPPFHALSNNQTIAHHPCTTNQSIK